MKATRLKSWIIWVTVALLVSAATNSLHLLDHWLMVSPTYNYTHPMFAMVLLIPFLMALLTMLVSLVALLVPQARRTASICLVCSIIFIAMFRGGIKIGYRIRMAAFEDLAIRSRPLVEAIHQYQGDTGAPPPTLEALVPDYLQAIPGTKMATYPDYVYLTGSDAMYYEDNEWVLLVYTPCGIIDFDMFFYFPNQRYLENGYWSPLERLGDWAYFHD